MNNAFLRVVYLLLLGFLVYGIAINFYEIYSSDYPTESFAFTLIMYFLLIVIIRLVRPLFPQRWGNIRTFFYLLIFIIPITFIFIEGYRYYFFISGGSTESNLSKDGNSREVDVFGTSHQPKLFEMIARKIDTSNTNINDSKQKWLFDTIWVYYNIAGEEVERLNYPKKFSNFYFYDKKIQKKYGLGN